MKLLRILSAAAVVALVAGSPGGPALAETPVLAPFPPPGGVSYAGVGTAIGSGGRTWEYEDFVSSAYGDLYYTIGAYDGPGYKPGQPSLSFNNGVNPMAFNASLSSLASGIAYFSGNTTVNTASGSQTIYTRFKLTVTDSSDSPLSLIDPMTVGLPSSVGAVLQVLGDFKANWQFLASTTLNGSYVSAKSLYDSLRTSPETLALRSDAGGMFYSTSPVPEPEAYGLALAGAFVLFLARRRRGQWADVG